MYVFFKTSFKEALEYSPTPPSPTFSETMKSNKKGGFFSASPLQVSSQPSPFTNWKKSSVVPLWIPVCYCIECTCFKRFSAVAFLLSETKILKLSLSSKIIMVSLKNGTVLRSPNLGGYVSSFSAI